MENNKKHTVRKTDIYKSDSSEMQNRINVIYLMILQGFQRKQIIQYCADTFKVGERQTDTYLEKAREIISSNILEDTNLKKNEIINQLYDLYQKNYSLEDYRECRNILLQISDVFGVKAPIKTDITSAGEKIQSTPIPLVLSDGRSFDDLKNELQPE